MYVVLSQACDACSGPPLPYGGGGIDSPRPASQRAAALVLTAAMLTTLAAPAFAKEWYIEDGNITVKAGDTEGKNKVSQGESTDVEDTDTIITNRNEGTASSNTVTIKTNDKDDKVEVTLKDVNIKADSGSALTSKGDVTLTLKGDNHLTGGNGSSGQYGSYGISGSGSLTITGGEGEKDSLTAQGGDGSLGGDGINISKGSLTISGGTVNAASGVGGSFVGTHGNGIDVGSLTVSGGTVTATGSNGVGYGNNGGQGGNGIHSGSVTISGGTVTANGGNSGGIFNGSDAIKGDKGVTISGGTVNANGGSGNSSYGGTGISSINGSVVISGGTVNAAGGNGSTGGGSSIYGKDIDLSGSLELTAKAGKGNNSNRPHLSQKGSELDLDTIKDELGPGAKVTATDADGKVIDQVPIPRPVEPEESSSSSGGGSAAPSAPASSLPGLTVTDKDGQRISYTSTQSGNTLTVCVGRLTASLRISLAALRQLRAEGIDTITFQTILCSTTLSVDELLAMGGEDAEAVLTHRLTDSSLTVG